MSDDGAPEIEQVLEQVRVLAERERPRCLWFLREDAAITDGASAIEVLRQIAKHGDLAAFRRAEQLKAWLSRHSSATS